MSLAQDCVAIQAATSALGRIENCVREGRDLEAEVTQLRQERTALTDQVATLTATAATRLMLHLDWLISIQLSVRPGKYHDKMGDKSCHGVPLLRYSEAVCMANDTCTASEYRSSGTRN